MKNSEIETYAMLQGITSIIDAFTSNYSRDDLLNEKMIAYTGFSSKEEMVKECVDKYIQVYETGKTSSFEENSNWFMSFMTACLTLDVSFDDGTKINSMLKKKSESLYKELSLPNKSFSYSDRHELKTYSTIVNLIGLGEQPLSNITNMLEKIDSNQHRWSYSYFSETVSQFVSLICRSDYDIIYNKYIKTIKKKKAFIREPIYMGIIRSGKLDKKTARKIRSDASEQLSYNCVQELFKYSPKYSSEAFQTLFTQFGDSNYYQVRRYLAQNVDPKQLMCLMGTSCDETKRIMQTRMREYYESLEEGE